MLRGFFITKGNAMFYLVGLRTHDGDDWIYEISKDKKIVNEFCVDRHNYPRNVISAYGMEIGDKIIDNVKNLDFVCLTQKKKAEILKIINRYRANNNFYRTGRGYWVFKIPIETQPNNQIYKIKEIGTLC